MKIFSLLILLFSVLIQAAPTDYQYVFVGGYLNEAIEEFYFKDNIKYLKNQGLTNIKTIMPCSHTTEEKAVQILKDELTELSNNSTDKIAIIAHSRGAQMMFHFALRNPEFVKNSVAKMFLIQGSHFGSPVADLVMHEPYVAPIPDDISKLQKFFLKSISDNSSFFHNFITELDGLETLTTNNAQLSLIQSLIAFSGNNIEDISSRTVFITSTKNPHSMSSAVKTTGWYMFGNKIESDGLVPLNRQFVPGFGEILNWTPADHTDLVVSKPFSKESKNLRYSLTQTILNHLE